jgi:hypothetical protein
MWALSATKLDLMLPSEYQNSPFFYVGQWSSGFGPGGVPGVPQGLQGPFSVYHCCLVLVHGQVLPSTAIPDSCLPLLSESLSFSGSPQDLSIW